MPTVVSEGLSLERRLLRARKGVAVRLGDETEAARLDLEIRVARLADSIRAEVEFFTAEQRTRLATLVLTGGATS